MRVSFRPDIAELRQRWAAGEPSGPVHHSVAKAAALTALGLEIVGARAAADVSNAHGVVSAYADVLTVHGWWETWHYPAHPTFWSQQNAIIGAALAQARVSVALSHFAADALQRLCPREIRVIPQAWDEQGSVVRRNWRQQYAVGDRPLALWPKLGAQPWCDPWPVLRLAAQRPDGVFFLLAQADDLRKFSGRELPPNVRCLGRLPAANLRGLFLECDLFLATSRETSGQAHLEALAAGVPVLSYAWGGLPESVTPACAVLTPPDDLAGYVAGYDQALANLAALKQAAPAQAAKYTWAQSAPRYVQLYNELMQ